MYGSTCARVSCSSQSFQTGFHTVFSYRPRVGKMAPHRGCAQKKRKKKRNKQAGYILDPAGVGVHYEHQRKLGLALEFLNVRSLSKIGEVGESSFLFWWWETELKNGRRLLRTRSAVLFAASWDAPDERFLRSGLARL